jgi:hypothetical protein
MALLLAPVGFGCGGDGGGGRDKPPGPEGKADDPGSVCTPGVDNCKDWTLLIYAAGDNDIEFLTVRGLDEIAQVGSTDQVNIVAQIDRSKGNSDRLLGTLGDFSGAKRLYVTRNAFGVIKEWDRPVNSADPQMLQEFITESIAAYPAAHYALFLVDHGMAWKGALVDEGEIESAEGGAATMSVPEIAGALKNGLGGTPLDLLTFHACLMANLEAMTEFAPYARYIIGSENFVISDGRTWGYADFGAYLTDRLKKGEQVSALDFATQVYDVFVRQCAIARERGWYQEDGKSLRCNEDATYSLIDTSKVNDLAASVNQLASLLWQGCAERSTALPVYKARGFAESYDGALVDLYHFIDLLPTDGRPDWAASITQVKWLLGYAADGTPRSDSGEWVVRRSQGGGADSLTFHAHGMSVYFPTIFPSSAVTGYRALAFNQLTAAWEGWNHLLGQASMFMTSDTVAPTVTLQSVSASGGSVAMSATLSGETDDVSEAAALIALRREGVTVGSEISPSGEEIPLVTDELYELYYEWPMAPAGNSLSGRTPMDRVPVLTNGETELPVTIQLQPASVRDYLNGATVLVGDIDLSGALKDPEESISGTAGKLLVAIDTTTNTITLRKATFEGQTVLTGLTKLPSVHDLKMGVTIYPKISRVWHAAGKPAGQWGRDQSPSLLGEDFLPVGIAYDATLRVELRPLSSFGGGPFHFGFMVRDVAGNIGLQLARPL